jgi:hypothetical protein
MTSPDTTTITLYPPLPPATADREVPFVVSTPPSQALDSQTVVAIALALNQLLPAGDLSVSSTGALTSSSSSPESAWSLAARIEAVSRSCL